MSRKKSEKPENMTDNKTDNSNISKKPDGTRNAERDSGHQKGIWGNQRSGEFLGRGNRRKVYWKE